MDNQSTFPYRFDGTMCKACRGHCCRGAAGYIWINRDDLKRMASAKNMAVPPFCMQYVRQVQGRLSLRERIINGEHLCCFFDPVDGRCTIYQSRPEQCRTFPFWDKFKKNPHDLLLECPGVTLA